MISFAFLKKELYELIRTPKLIIIGSVFLFFSITGVLSARFIEDIFRLFASDLEITLPDPTHIQSWEQFFNNISSISMIVFLIMLTGSIASEKHKGSVYLVLTKNMTRTSFVCSKVIAGIILFTGVYVLALLVHMYYTWFLFDALLYDGYLISVLAVYVLGIFFTMIAITLSIFLKTSTHAALIAFAVYALLNILTVFSGLNRFNPAGSIAIIYEGLAGKNVTSALLINIFVTLVLSVLLFLISLRSFSKQEL